jgi:hypothetical protein
MCRLAGAAACVVAECRQGCASNASNNLCRLLPNWHGGSCTAGLLHCAQQEFCTVCSAGHRMASRCYLSCALYKSSCSSMNNDNIIMRHASQSLAWPLYGRHTSELLIQLTALQWSVCVRHGWSMLRGRKCFRQHLTAASCINGRQRVVDSITTVAAVVHDADSLRGFVYVRLASLQHAMRLMLCR